MYAKDATPEKLKAQRASRKARRALISNLAAHGKADMLRVNAGEKQPDIVRLQKAWYMASPKVGQLFLKWVATNATRKVTDK